eukprot:scaffold24327_cov312-Skeletonema_dohrnii-CCMP3373.AAC.1
MDPGLVSDELNAMSIATSSVSLKKKDDEDYGSHTRRVDTAHRTTAEAACSGKYIACLFLYGSSANVTDDVKIWLHNLFMSDMNKYPTTLEGAIEYLATFKSSTPSNPRSGVTLQPREEPEELAFVEVAQACWGC